MKKLIVISGIILLVANLSFGLILTKYPMFNVGVNSAVIIATMVFLYVLQVIRMKDAFVISQSFLFLFLGIVMFILGCFAPQRFADNWCLMVIILLIVFEGILLLITNLMSNK